MKALLLSLLVVVSPLVAVAQNQPAVSTQDKLITISARGTDVRTVLHDLFTQARKNVVLENLPRIELFLSLNSVDFDETLEIVCRLANLRYEVQNGIYYISKARPAATTPTRANQPAPTAGAAAPSQAAVRAVGRLPQNVLQRAVSGTFNRLDLREVAKRLGDQAKVTVEIDPSVPRYRLDMKLNPTSLGYALRVISERLELEMVFTDHQTLLLRPKAPASAVERFTVSTEN